MHSNYFYTGIRYQFKNVLKIHAVDSSGYNNFFPKLYVVVVCQSIFLGCTVHRIDKIVFIGENFCRVSVEKLYLQKWNACEYTNKTSKTFISSTINNLVCTKICLISFCLDWLFNLNFWNLPYLFVRIQLNLFQR